MSVKTQYVVQHKGEDKLVTCDKKEADLYDKMLDTADNIAQLLTSQGITVDEKQLEDISIALSKNKDAVAKLFRGKSFDDIKDELVEEKTGD